MISMIVCLSYDIYDSMFIKNLVMWRHVRNQRYYVIIIFYVNLNVILFLQYNLLLFWISFFIVYFDSVNCLRVILKNGWQKYPSVVKYSRNNKKHILVLYVIIIFYVNLHGNPSFSLIYKNDVVRGLSTVTTTNLSCR
jgi:hypothetical protein